MANRELASETRFYSDLAIPPGETLLDELRERGITQKAFAGMICVALLMMCMIWSGSMVE